MNNFINYKIKDINYNSKSTSTIMRDRPLISKKSKKLANKYNIKL
jgi:hypothetical protein